MDGIIKVGDVASGKCLRTFVGYGYIISVSFDNTGLLASCSTDSKVRVFDVKTGKLLHVLCGHLDEYTERLEQGEVYSVSFDKHGLLASGSMDKSTQV